MFSRRRDRAPSPPPTVATEPSRKKGGLFSRGSRESPSSSPGLAPSAAPPTSAPVARARTSTDNWEAVVPSQADPQSRVPTYAAAVPRSPPPAVMRTPPVATARSSDEFAPLERGGSSAADLMMADARSGGWHGIAPTEAAAPSAASQTERRVPVAARLAPASTEGQRADRGAAGPAKPATPAAVRSTEPAAPPASFMEEHVHPWSAQSGPVAADRAAGPSRLPAAAMPAASSSRPKAVALATPTPPRAVPHRTPCLVRRG